MADLLDGGAGDDRLSGGGGNDTYRFAVGSGVDTISEYDTTVGNADILAFGPKTAIEQLWFRKVANDLEVSIIGTPDKVTVSNWYAGSAYHVEQFQTAGGKVLLDSQVQNLVQAMASFAPPASGQTTLTAAYQTTLAPVLAANWH